MHSEQHVQAALGSSVTGFVPGILQAAQAPAADAPVGALSLALLTVQPFSQSFCRAQENIYRNFGMPQPNGYRKALRFMRHAEKFGFPIITFVDTPGAYAGKNAEDLGQVCTR